MTTVTWPRTFWHGVAQCALGAVLAHTWVASAQTPPPAPATAWVCEIGAPRRSTSVNVAADAGGNVRITADGGSEPTQSAVLDVSRIDLASLEVIELGPHAAVALVHVQAGSERAIAMIGARDPMIWTGHEDLRGDLGERTADVVTVTARTGGPETYRDVGIGWASETHRLCGAPETILAPRMLDPQTLEFHPAPVRRTSTAAAAVVRAAAETPTRGLVRALTATGTSMPFSGGPGSPTPDGLDPPRSLVDGDLRTSWSVPASSSETFFASLRWSSAAHPVVALGVVPLPLGPADPTRAAPRRIVVIDSSSTAIAIELPAIVAPGEFYVAHLPAALESDCLSLVLVARETARSVESVCIAEVVGLTALDVDPAAGALGLARELDGAATSDDAARLLLALGPSASHAVAFAYGSLGAPGRRRALAVLRRLASWQDAELSVLAQGLNDPDLDVANEAVRAAVLAGRPGAELLTATALRQDPIAPVAALAVAEQDPGLTLARLVPALGQSPSHLGPAIASAVRRTGASAGHALNDAGARSLAAPAAAVLAHAIAVVPELADWTAGYVTEQLPRAESFEAQWELVQAARALPMDGSGVDAWLLDLTRHSDAWMLRAAALDALATRGAAGFEAAVTERLADEYPRVRMHAVTIAGASGIAEARLRTIARQDPWSMVREAAINAIARSQDGRNVLIAAVDDRAARVRARAITLLTEAHDRTAAPRVLGRLRDEAEVPVVLAAAIQYAERECQRGAADALAAIARRPRSPLGAEPRIETALLAVRALGALAARDALEDLRDHSPSEPVARTAREALARPASCGP